MAVSLTSVDLAKIPDNGGYLLKLTGVFEPGTTHRVYIGTTGSSTDPQALGFQGDGNLVQPFTATEMRIYTPLLELGGPLDIHVVQVDGGANDTLAAVLTSVKPDFKSRTFDMRRILPPFWKLGPRNMDLLAATPLPTPPPEVGWLEAVSHAIGESDNEIGSLFITRLTSSLSALTTPLGLTLVWKGTVTPLAIM